MSTDLLRAGMFAASDLAIRPTQDDTIRRQVWSLLAGLYPHYSQNERRAAQRFAFPQLLYLTTTEADGRTPGEETIVVVGKTLSEGGLGFFHHHPIPHRRMIATVQNQAHEHASFLIDLTWCRFTTHGWYESGGRFLQVVPSPLAEG